MRNHTYRLYEVLIRVDRTTVGNPFRMYTEEQRDEVCDKYESYFYRRLQKDKKFRDYVEYIVDTARKHDVALGCWCYPKRCHAETIKRYVEERLRGDH